MLTVADSVACEPRAYFLCADVDGKGVLSVEDMTWARASAVQSTTARLLRSHMFVVRFDREPDVCEVELVRTATGWRLDVSVAPAETRVEICKRGE